MVEYSLTLDTIFGSLADPVRRDILQRVSQNELTVSEVAQPYDISLAAVSKHIQILEKAQLIYKRRQGKKQYVHTRPSAFNDATQYLQQYESMWNHRFDALEQFLDNQQEENEPWQKQQ